MSPEHRRSLRTSLRSAFTLLALALPVAPVSVPAQAVADDAAEPEYERAVSALQSGRAAPAAQLFDELLAKMPEKHPLRTLALYGSARAHQKAGTPEAACHAVERYKAFIGRPDAEPVKREKAANGLADLIALCQTKTAAGVVAPVTPVLPVAVAPVAASELAIQAAPVPAIPDRTWAWVATGTAGASVVGGAVMLAVASGAVSDADAANKRFHASGDTDATARRQVLDGDDRASTFGYAGYGALGVGAAVGGLAAWLWMRGDGGCGVSGEGTAVVVPVGQGGGVVGVF